MRMKVTLSSRRLTILLCTLALLCSIALWLVYTISTGYRGWTAPMGRMSRAYARWRGFTAKSFRFAPSKPAWLTTPVPAPLVLQIAVISALEEFEQRAFLREWVYSHQRVDEREVVFDVKFFVGRSGATDGAGRMGQWTSVVSNEERMRKENGTFGDMALIPVVENTYALCRKRFEAIKWAAQKSQQEYDFLFTVDTDSFVRLTALARRIHHMWPNLSPRTHYAMWGSMMTTWRHWHKSSQLDAPDEDYVGEWYEYPIGQGYLMSSALVKRLDGVSDELSHHLPYYQDDQAVGAWISEFAPETIIINDEGGFHDPPGHGLRPHPIEYDTVLIHHVNVQEMIRLREMAEWDGEWLPLPADSNDSNGNLEFELRSL